MNLTADTNLLARVLFNDDLAQAPIARAVLGEAALIAIPTIVFCELAWLLRRASVSTDAFIGFVERLIGAPVVVSDRPAVQAGLAALRAGGDFADGVIAFSGALMGGAVFVSFDKQAVALRRETGGMAALPEELALNP